MKYYVLLCITAVCSAQPHKWTFYNNEKPKGWTIYTPEQFKTTCKLPSIDEMGLRSYAHQASQYRSFG